MVEGATALFPMENSLFQEKKTIRMMGGARLDGGLFGLLVRLPSGVE